MIHFQTLTSDTVIKDSEWGAERNVYFCTNGSYQVVLPTTSQCAGQELGMLIGSAPITATCEDSIYLSGITTQTLFSNTAYNFVSDGEKWVLVSLFLGVPQ